MRHWRLISILTIALGGARPSMAGSNAGADPFDFLFLDANARAVGMGGAYTALASDSNALIYNPAGLGRVNRHEVTFMHNRHFQGINQEYIGFAARQGWGLNLNYLNFGEVRKTTIDNPEGDGLGDAGLRDLAAGAGYGFAVDDSLSLGVGAKYIQETIENVSARGYAIDAGALYSVPFIPKLTLGLAIQNMGPPVKFQSAEENLPLNIRAGAAYGFKVLGQRNTLSLDVTKQRTEGALIAGGFETVLADVMPVRVGFNTRNDAGSGITAGVGWILNNVQFDYAFIPFGDLGITHRLSATLRWGAIKVAEEAPSGSGGFVPIEQLVEEARKSQGGGSPGVSAKVEKIKKRDEDLRSSAESKRDNMPVPSDRRGKPDYATWTRGVVEVKSNGKWEPLKEGFPLQPGDAIRTGGDGTAKLWVGEGYTVLDRKSKVTIKSNLELLLEEGRIHWERVKKALTPREKYRFRTPTAVVAVRGTEFDLEYSNGMTKFSPFSGTVELEVTMETSKHPRMPPSTLPKGKLAQIQDQSGDVQVLVSGQQTWQPTSSGDSFSAGEQIRTGAQGKATFALEGGFWAELGPNSVFRLGARKSDGHPFYGLWQGMLHAWREKDSVHRRSPAFVTPTAVAGVRGTEFFLDVSPVNKRADFIPYSGKLEIAADKNRLNLGDQDLWWGR